MTELGDLFVRWGTDKGIYGYTPYYEQAFATRRDIRNVLEIGICGYRDIPNNVVGASLFCWRDYFQHANIWGIDNDGRFIFNDQPRIGTFLADAYHANFVTTLYEIMERTGGAGFDFVCDDAVHDPQFQIQLLRVLWPFVSPGGIYAIEETCQWKLPNHDFAEYYRRMMPADGRATAHQSTHGGEVLLIVEKMI